jgi:ribosomal protein S18 acetylase RimI-like enzyme
VWGRKESIRLDGLLYKKYIVEVTADRNGIVRCRQTTIEPFETMLIRRLVPTDALAFRTLRLAALQECPSAFSASYEEECATPLSAIEANLAPESGRNLFGAFDGDELAGMVGVGRESAPKLRHKASIRAMYVAPGHRGKGAGKQLFAHALAFAEAMPGLRHVTLVVTAGNDTAIALYQANGFTVYGHEPGALFADGMFYDDIYMLRQVAPAQVAGATS